MIATVYYHLCPACQRDGVSLKPPKKKCACGADVQTSDCQVCFCNRCLHGWGARGTVPKKCAKKTKCGSPYWNSERDPAHIKSPGLPREP